MQKKKSKKLEPKVNAPTETTTSQTKEKKKRNIRRAFNGLTPQLWTKMSRNVWSDVSSPRGKRQLAHGAVFPLKLAERMITLFSDVGDLVVDPFAGIGTTNVAALRLGRPSIGIELNPNFVEEAEKWLDEEDNLLSNVESRVFKDDCRKIANYVKPDSIQLSFTSPPYANFIQRSVADRKNTHKKSRIVLDNNSKVKQYSLSEHDFGNLNYETFLKNVKELLSIMLELTKVDGYSAWVVKDYRLPPNRPYISMHSDIAQMAVEVGWLWHDLIIWDQNEQRRLVLLGYPTRFYTNQNCSFIVVLRRGK